MAEYCEYVECWGLILIWDNILCDLLIVFRVWMLFVSVSLMFINSPFLMRELTLINNGKYKQTFIRQIEEG